LSLACIDRNFVSQLYRWLTEVASMNMWYDFSLRALNTKQLPGGDFANGRTTGVEDRDLSTTA